MVVALLIALCTVVLAKWLALVAFAAVVLALLARPAVRRVTRRFRERRAARGPALVAVPGARVVDEEPDCSWCGLAGGHRDPLGRPLRPRLAHVIMPAPDRRAS